MVSMINENNKMNKRFFNRNKLFCLIISLGILFWIWPITNNSPGIGIDPSMIIGFHWSETLGLEFGKDIILTYGPLYFLGGPINWLNNSSMSMLLYINKVIYFIGNILLVILWFGSIFILAVRMLEKLNYSKLKNRVISIIILSITIFIFLYIPIMLPDYLLILSIFILISVLQKEILNSEDIFLIIFVGFVLAIISLVKFSYIAGAVSLIVLSIIYSLVLRKSWKIFVLLLSFIASISLIWLLTGQSLKSFFLYLKNGLLITSGYSEYVIRALQGKVIILMWFAVLLFIFWIFMIIFGLIKKNKSITIFFLFSFPILFLFFKDGFVRPDEGHYPLYFKFIIYLSIIAIIFFNRKQWKIILIFILLIIIAIPFSGLKYSFNINNRVLNNINETKVFIKNINPKYVDEYMEKIEEDKKALREEYFLNEDIIKEIDKEDKVDIFPFYVFIPYMYNLNWDPRPVFQSYVVYKPELDDINAEHFSNNYGPDKIIYKIINYEEKYQIFDEPAVFKEFIKNYRFSFYDDIDGYCVLEKKKSETDFKEKVILSANSTFGEKIDLPDISDGFLFCNINIELNIFGKLKKLLYKGEPLYMHFYFKDPSKKAVVMKFYRENAKNGLFLSRYIDNALDLKSVLEQQYLLEGFENDIESIEITTDNEKAFKNEFIVEFINMYMVDQDNYNIDFNFLKKDNSRFKINIDELKENAIIGSKKTIKGWAIDLKDPGYKGKVVILFYDGDDRNDNNYLGSAQYYLLRDDVADHFGEKEYKYSGFIFNLDTTKLENGKHDIYICYLNENGIYADKKVKIIVKN